MPNITKIIKENGGEESTHWPRDPPTQNVSCKMSLAIGSAANNPQ